MQVVVQDREGRSGEPVGMEAVPRVGDHVAWGDVICEVEAVVWFPLSGGVDVVVRLA